MKKFISFSILYFSLNFLATAQPVQWFNPQKINPAFAGFTVGNQLAAQHRIGYPGFAYNDQATTLSYQMPLNKINSGIGAQLDYRRIGGLLFGGGFNLQYTYQKNIAENYNIRFGAQFGIRRTVVENGEMSFGNQFSTGFGIQNPERSRFSDLVDLSLKHVNFGVGTVINVNNLLAGFAVRHYKVASVQFTSLELAAHAGYYIMLSEDVEKGWVLFPNVVFASGNSWADAQLGIQASKDIYTFGTALNSLGSGSFNWNLLCGVNVNRYRIGYSFNIPLAAFNRNFIPSHEFFLSFRIGKPYNGQVSKQAKLLNRFF